MDLSNIHGNKLQMRFPHHKSVYVRVQVKEIFLFFPILRRKFLFFPTFHIFIPIFLFFASHLALDTLPMVTKYVGTALFQW